MMDEWKLPVSENERILVHFDLMIADMLDIKEDNDTTTKQDIFNHMNFVESMLIFREFIYKLVRLNDNFVSVGINP